MAYKFPPYTSKVHRAAYPAISPSNPDNSVVDRVVLITGGGAGIGLAISEAFITAGAKAVTILGRRENVLREAVESLEKKAKTTGTRILSFQADVTDSAALERAFALTAEEVGPIDIVVANAGYLPTPGPLATVDLDDWWEGYEINIRGTALLFRAWLSYRAPSGGKHKPAFISVNSSVAHLQVLPTLTGYAGSKAGLASVLSAVQAENPDIHIASFHPGVVETDMNREMVRGSDDLDSPSLPAAFAVWLCSPAAEWLGGKMVWANWDVDELVARKQEIVERDELRMGLLGYPRNVGAVTIVTKAD